MYLLFFAETKKTTVNCDSVFLSVGEIVENGRECNLEMDAEAVVELIYSPDSELTVDELIELKKQSTVEEIDKDFVSRRKYMTVTKLKCRFLKILIQMRKVQ